MDGMSQDLAIGHHYMERLASKYGITDSSATIDLTEQHHLDLNIIDQMHRAAAEVYNDDTEQLTPIPKPALAGGFLRIRVDQDLLLENPTSETIGVPTTTTPPVAVKVEDEESSEREQPSLEEEEQPPPRSKNETTSTTSTTTERPPSTNDPNIALIASLRRDIKRRDTELEQACQKAIQQADRLTSAKRRINELEQALIREQGRNKHLKHDNTELRVKGSQQAYEFQKAKLDWQEREALFQQKEAQLKRQILEPRFEPLQPNTNMNSSSPPRTTQLPQIGIQTVEL